MIFEVGEFLEFGIPLPLIFAMGLFLRKLIYKGCKQTLSNAEIKKLEKDGEIHDIFLAVKFWNKEMITKPLTKTLRDSGNPQYIFWGGLRWPGRKVTSFGRSLIETDDKHYIFMAGRYWPESTYIPELCHYILDLEDDDLFLKVILTWPRMRLIESCFPVDSIIQNESKILRESIFYHKD